MPKSLQEQIDACPYWYHRIELPDGIVTPGWAPIAPDAYAIPEDMAGMRVLDVGAWDGYWTFEALRRGADEVLAIENFSDLIDPQWEAGHRTWRTFDLCRDALGYSKEICRREAVSLYDVTKERFGEFDVVFFFGTLYHCRYPLLALDTLSKVCRQMIFVESATCNRVSGHRGQGEGYPDSRHVVAEFFPQGTFNQLTNWWVPTLSCMAMMMKAAGWPTVVAWELTDTPSDLPECRGHARGSKYQSVQDKREEGHTGLSYSLHEPASKRMDTRRLDKPEEQKVSEP